MGFPILATYRLQLRGPSSGFGFTFADAENLLDYLDELGVSHLYPVSYTHLLLATMTKWPSILFGFMEQVCEGDECGAVPFGIDYYIRPLVWGGIGAAITAATLGPFVSMLKGWYMSFWPALALALIVISAVVGSVLTMICRPYWGG